MQMHLYGLHPSFWKIVCIGVTISAEGEALTIEHEQDLHHNVQKTTFIMRSLCAQEFSKVWNIQIAKVIWDTLKEAREGTDHVRQGKIDLIHRELEGLKRRTREGESEWEPIKILLEGDRGSNKMNTTSNTRLRLNYPSWPKPRSHWSATSPRNKHIAF
jgi:hypothetical protein